MERGRGLKTEHKRRQNNLEKPRFCHLCNHVSFSLTSLHHLILDIAVTKYQPPPFVDFFLAGMEQVAFTDLVIARHSRAFCFPSDRLWGGEQEKSGATISIGAVMIHLVLLPLLAVVGCLPPSPVRVRPRPVHTSDRPLACYHPPAYGRSSSVR